MGAWFAITVAAMTVVMWRLVSAASVIWQERARVASHCTQMETAALNPGFSSGTGAGAACLT
jgi:hypothetical protein